MLDGFMTMEAEKSRQWMRPSVFALILANLIPIFGVLVLKWEVFPLLLLFWVENVLIGIFNAVKMLSSIPGHPGLWLIKIFIVPFFCFHYGMFTFVHGIFVVGFFGGAFQKGGKFPDAEMFLSVIRDNNLWWGVLGLAVSHGISFATNYIGRGEYLKVTPMDLMKQPYGRVMVLHFTILVGGGLMVLLKSPTIGLLLLVILKIGLDLRAHLREHQKLESIPIPEVNTTALK